MSLRSRAFSLIEILVVCAIIGVLLAMLLPAIQRARNVAANAACVNNMRQMGIALHTFHDAHKHFPANGDVSFYVELLPYVEQNQQVETWDVDGAQPVATFLCPVRRTPETAQARVDFAGAVPSGSNKVILGGATVKLPTVNAQDGASNTIVLAHKSVAVGQYAGGTNDVDWGSSLGLNHRRNATRHVRDAFAGTSSNSAFGAAHSGKFAPVLMADGAMQQLKYGTSTTLLTGFFNYNGKEIERVGDDYVATEVDYGTGSQGGGTTGGGTVVHPPGGTGTGKGKTSPGGPSPEL